MKQASDKATTEARTDIEDQDALADEALEQISGGGVKVTSYSVNGSGLDDGSVPMETLSLNYEK